MRLAYKLLSDWQIDIRVTLYKRAPELKKLSAGFGFPDNVVECMRDLDPRLADAVIKTGIRSEGIHRWVDGMTKSDLRLMRDEDIPAMSVFITAIEDSY